MTRKEAKIRLERMQNIACWLFWSFIALVLLAGNGVVIWLGHNCPGFFDDLRTDDADIGIFCMFCVIWVFIAFFCSAALAIRYVGRAIITRAKIEIEWGENDEEDR